MKRVAIAYSKLRNEIGLVGIEAREKKVHIKLVRHWDSREINKIPPLVASLHKKFMWGETFIEQETGEYFISTLRNDHKLSVRVITTGKKVKDPKQLQKIKTMDKIEMTEFLRKLKLNGQIKFPTNPSPNMKTLEKQIPFFSKHTTEAGTVDYYAPGSEPDDLVKALMIACFSIRNMLEGDMSTSYCAPLDYEQNDIEFDVEKQFTEMFPNSVY